MPLLRKETWDVLENHRPKVRDRQKNLETTSVPCKHDLLGRLLHGTEGSNISDTAPIIYSPSFCLDGLSLSETNM